MGVEKLPVILAAAAQVEKDTGCPKELLAAQCILESGWLNHAPGNNCFGIKSYAGEYGRQLLETSEWFTPDQLRRFLALGDGRTAKLVFGQTEAAGKTSLYLIQDWFATFPTLAACFAKRAALFNEAPYLRYAQRYAQDRNLTALVKGIAPLYATDPHYAQQVLTIINQPNVQAALNVHAALKEATC